MTLTRTHDFFQVDTFESGGVASVASGALLAVGSGSPSDSSGFDPAIGSTFDIIGLKPGELSGAFGSIVGQTFNNGTEQFNVIYDNADGDVALTVSAAGGAAAPEPSTWVLCVAGLAGVLISRIRRKRPDQGR